jgi:hypothetical protein
VREAYLEPWRGIAPADAIATAYAAVPSVGAVDRILTWHRVATFADDTALPYVAASEFEWLREILAAFD